MTVEPVLNGYSKKTQEEIFETDNHLMQVKSIAEGVAFCNTLDLH